MQFLESKVKTMSSESMVYVVRDAGGEYIRGRWSDDDGCLVASDERTPASNEAMEFESRGEAEAACSRATDRVIETEVN